MSTMARCSVIIMVVFSDYHGEVFSDYHGEVFSDYHGGVQ